MPNQQPPSQTLTISEVKKELSSFINKVSRNDTRVLIEKRGIPVAAIISAADLARLKQLDREWDEETKAIKRFSQAFADVPTEELEAEVARIIAEKRQRRAAEAEGHPA